MQSSIANGEEQRNIADNSNSCDYTGESMPDVEVISVDPNAFYASTDEDDDDDYVDIDDMDDDPAVMIATDSARGIASNMMLTNNESVLVHESQHMLPDNNLFDVIALNINDDILPDLRYDDIFLTNSRADEVHQFDLASYINGDSTSLILSPVEVPSTSNRRSFENRTSAARKCISFSMDLEEDEHTKSHLVHTSAHTTVNTNFINNRFRGKSAPCDIDSRMYLNDEDEDVDDDEDDDEDDDDDDEEEEEEEMIVSTETIPAESSVPTTTFEPCSDQTNVPIEVSQQDGDVNNSQIIEEITIDEVKIEEVQEVVEEVDELVEEVVEEEVAEKVEEELKAEVVEEIVEEVVEEVFEVAKEEVEEKPLLIPSLPMSLPMSLPSPQLSPPASIYVSEDSLSSSPSIDLNYEASAEVTETSTENSPARLDIKCEQFVDDTTMQPKLTESIGTNTEPPVAEPKPSIKRKLNIQEYLRRKMLNAANEQNVNAENTATTTNATRSSGYSKDTVNKTDQTEAVCSNKSLYQEIIVVSMGCNTDISLPATPFISADNPKLAKSTELLCNIQSAVEKLSSTTDTTKLSSSSLISSIQDVILKKSSDPAICVGNSVKAQKPTKSVKHDTNSENNEEEAELEHGENKVIMHLPRDRIRPITWAVSIQTDPYFQFPPLELLPPITTKKAHAKDFGDQSRDSQFYSSPSYVSDELSEEETGSSSPMSTASEMTMSSGASTSSYNSTRTYYNDEHGRRTHCKRRSSNSSGYGTYGSTKRSTSPEERRIVYVGRIEEQMTRSELHRKFSKYGAIKQISIHRKDASSEGPYGFITFDRPSEAYTAIDDSPKNPEIAHYSISFGGRRAFCGQKYYDLDNSNSYTSAASVSSGGPPMQSREDGSFDSLLRSLKSKLCDSRNKQAV